MEINDSKKIDTDEATQFLAILEVDKNFPPFEEPITEPESSHYQNDWSAIPSFMVIFLNSEINIWTTFLYHSLIVYLQFQPISIPQYVNHVYWQNSTNYCSNLVKNLKSQKSFNFSFLIFVLLYIHLSMDLPITSLHLSMTILTIHRYMVFPTRNP